MDKFSNFKRTNYQKEFKIIKSINKDMKKIKK